MAVEAVDSGLVQQLADFTVLSKRIAALAAQRSDVLEQQMTDAAQVGVELRVDTN